jgi:hypothetical protein
MKAMNLFKSLLFLVAIAGFVLTGCQKDKQNDLTPDSSSLQQLSKDENTLQTATDEALNDVNQVLSGSGLKSTNLWPCNATIDSTEIINDTIIFFITYNGLNCNETRFRTGKVEVRKQVGTQWHDAGATVIVKYLNLSITKVATGKTIILNGTKTFQNVTGGYIWQLGNQYTSIVHKVWGEVEATFDDLTTRTWNISRQRTFTGTLGALVMTINGFGTAGAYDNLVVWGVNRQGEEFYSQINEPVVFKETCSWDPCSGVRVYQIPSDDKSATVTFGYDNNNQLIVNGDCPTKYKVDWQKNSNSGTVYLFLQ